MIDCTKSIAITNLSPQSENINLRLGVCLFFELVLTPSVLSTLSLSRKKMTSWHVGEWVIRIPKWSHRVYNLIELLTPSSLSRRISGICETDRHLCNWQTSLFPVIKAIIGILLSWRNLQNYMDIEPMLKSIWSVCLVKSYTACSETWGC